MKGRYRILRLGDEWRLELPNASIAAKDFQSGDTLVASVERGLVVHRKPGMSPAMRDAVEKVLTKHRETLASLARF